MKRLIPLLTSIVLFVPLAGCKDQVPKCSDDDTIALVKNIVAEQLGDGDEVAEVKAQFVIEYPRASSFNESIKKYECEAKLISGGTYQLPITYDSQIDDSGQHIVAVGGIGRGDLFQLAAAAAEKIKEAKDAAERARAAAPVVAPRPQPTPPAVASNPSAAPQAVTPPAPVSNPSPTPPQEASPSTAVVQAPPAETMSAKPSDVDPAQAASTKEDSSRMEMAKPSFDCSRATTLVENTICDDGELASLDALLAVSYARMMSSDIGDGARAALKADQRAWLGRRNQCTSKTCLSGLYESRIDEVCEVPVLSGVHPDCGR